ncbi:beta-glucoside operon antiterminator [Paenibacillus terrae HPL-003]|uniref:Beta-glucoside operon antiterminator n=1 Tax=Paenibacillus terrae (strain HPL-003) TaxID=985665 RepID=G7VVJ6_PAETH|nr:PRD domain-containing protein [Paenibacillus terrae]AET57030.1 beta-glucoside operon antiterminator [Paenibacillus terrae HPL-003]
MKVVKKINNNVAICIDNNNQELVVFGKGIGFKPMPYELDDLSLIDRTFYGVDPRYLNLFNFVPESIFQLTARIVDLAKNKIEYNLNPNITFTLADHINFAIERAQKKVNIKSPLQSSVERLYPLETEIGKAAVQLIEKEMKIALPSGEASSIAVHFINAQSAFNAKKAKYNEQTMDDIIRIIEDHFQIEINTEDFNYIRFVTHLKTLLTKKGEQLEATDEYKITYEELKKQFSEFSNCVDKIKQYFIEQHNWKLNEEESLYLILHVSRLCNRERHGH